MMKYLTCLCLCIVAVALTGCTGESESESRKKFAAALDDASQHIDAAFRGFSTTEYLDNRADADLSDFQLQQLDKAQQALAAVAGSGSPEQTVAANIIRAEILSAEAGATAAEAKYEFFSSPLIRGERLKLSAAYTDAGLPVPEYVAEHDQALPELVTAPQAAMSLADMIDSIEETLFLSKQYETIDYQTTITELQQKMAAVQSEIDSATQRRNQEKALLDDLQGKYDALQGKFQQNMTKASELEQQAFRAEEPEKRYELNEQAAQLKKQATLASHETERLAGQIEIAQADLTLAEQKLETAQAKLDALKRSREIIDQREADTRAYADQADEKAQELYAQFMQGYNAYMDKQRRIIGPPADTSLMGQAADKMNEAINRLNQNVPGVEDRSVTATRDFYLGTKQLELGSHYYQWSNMEQQVLDSVQVFIQNAEGLDSSKIDPLRNDVAELQTQSNAHAEQSKSMLTLAIGSLDSTINAGTDADLIRAAKRAKLTAAKSMALLGETTVDDADLTAIISDLEAELAPAPPADTPPAEPESPDEPTTEEDAGEPADA